eukprot:CAMPEP_0197515056 /NCGR_PEP_ID=MMETSP1318-20131121/301_1 /TAXON_ID=552666 /ORGANISM="Partenskyella glossopodia, Strain RCC365" /LENGTH=69 /DNA_ID=CAMNT_0043063315 /DNA_START=126 /DNA_END=335 /DNA_ORIENTATION=+
MSGETNKVSELKNEVAKLQAEIEALKAVKMSPQDAANQILDHLKKADIDPIMATDNPWRPNNPGCCTVS